MIRTLFILTALLGSISTAPAQSLAAFRDHLAVPAVPAGSYRPAAVTVTEHGDAADAAAKAARDNTRLRFKGYRVCVFFDNGQDARAGAESARALFASSFPDTRVYIAYSSPYFTVTAGDCVTSEEAIILMGRVKELFPKAFLKNEELSIADLIQ